MASSFESEETSDGESGRDADSIPEADAMALLRSALTMPFDAETVAIEQGDGASGKRVAKKKRSDASEAVATEQGDGAS